MITRRGLCRAFLQLAVILALAVAAFLLFNVRGWRTRVLARVLRTENGPIVVVPPANFQPNVPAGFKVSVFAKGFRQPRWLAVAPDGDILCHRLRRWRSNCAAWSSTAGPS